jgi:hypothetical protein
LKKLQISQFFLAIFPREFFHTAALSMKNV